MNTTMVKTLKRNLLTLALVVATVVTFVTPAYAATSNKPYGFTYDNSASGKTIYEYYSYSGSAYKATRGFYSRNVAVYTASGNLVTSQSKGSGALYNGFDTKGNFFIITANGELLKSDTSNTVSTVLKSGALRLNYNADDLATTIFTNDGTKSLSTLNTVPDTDNSDDTTVPSGNKAKNRVDLYNNSANEMVYDSYENGKLKTRIIVGGNKVLNATASVRLSETLIGAKFLGFDTKYNVYLYESNGTLYRFKQGTWFSAEKLQLSGNYKGFKTDDNGFISKVVTSKDSYTIKQLTTSSKWKAKKTYAVSKNNYTTLYKKGSIKSNTLTLTSGKLYLNGKKIASNISKFGFASNGKIVYLKKGTLYTSKITSPTSTSKLFTKVKTLKTNSVGLVSKVLLTSGKTKKVG